MAVPQKPGGGFNRPAGGGGYKPGGGGFNKGGFRGRFAPAKKQNIVSTILSGCHRFV